MDKLTEKEIEIIVLSLNVVKRLAESTGGLGKMFPHDEACFDEIVEKLSKEIKSGD